MSNRPAPAPELHRRFLGGYHGAAVGPNADRSRLFQEDVRQRMEELNWGYGRLKAETGVYGQSILNSYEVRPEYVVVAAAALGLDVERSLERAGWEIRTLLQRKIVECLQRVKRHRAIADAAGISRGLIGLYLRNPDMVPTVDVLTGLAAVLPLTPADLEIIRLESGQRVDLSSMRHLIPDVAAFETFGSWIEAVAEAVGASIYGLSLNCGLGKNTLWNIAHGQKGAGQRVRAALAENLGVSVGELVRLVPHKPTAPREDYERRARKISRTKRTKARRRQILAAHNDERHEDGLARRAAAEQDADALGQYVHLVDGATFAHAHRIQKAAALEILRKVRERQPRLT